MEYSVNLATFQGPFDLLYYLIEKKEIDIYDIPISEITEQYLEYLDEMKHMNLEITSEFILMASTLIEIKSKMLLPVREDDDEDPRTELMNQLLEYKVCKYVSERLREYEKESSLFYTKPKDCIEIDENFNTENQLYISGVNVVDLYNIYLKLLRERNVNIVETPPKMNKVYRESYSVKDCIDNIRIKLKKMKCISVFEMFKEKQNIYNNKEYVVSVFLAILELSKSKGICIVQKENFSDILIKQT